MSKQVLNVFVVAMIAAVGIAEATAPHPRVRERIRLGLQPEPYYLKHLDELRQAGVDAPWIPRRRALQKTVSPGTLIPVYGRLTSLPDSVNALAILVDFPDSVHHTNATYFDTLLFDESTRSVRDYYRMISYGNLDLITVDLPSTFGWVRADSAYNYYVNGENGTGPDSYPNNAQKLVEEVVQAVDPFVDYRKYDNDQDGEVDALFIVHAGPGAEYTGSDDDIWSHAWATSEPQYFEQHRVAVYAYTMEPEYLALPGDMTIGVFAHELGHTLFDLPDLYDTDYSSNGLDDWSLMASGSWLGENYKGSSPAYPDAWSRVRMGFATMVNIAENIVDKPIVNQVSSSLVYRLWTNGSQGNEYFLVENRQKIGYDSYLWGSGLLIYHVDESVGTNDNEWYPGYTGSGHYLVALEQADGLYDLEQGEWADGGDPFPGETDQTEFYDFSFPYSWSYGGGLSGVSVTRISDPGDTMRADLFINPGQQAMVQSVADVPEDQGGEIYVTWEASPDESDTLRAVTAYGLWMKDADTASTIPLRTIRLNDGFWHEVAYIDSIGDSSYTIEAFTLADSNHTGYNLSFVRIATYSADSLILSLTDVFSGYSVDNLAPLPPTGLAAVLDVDQGIRLSWNPNTEPDLADYRLYRGTSADFLPVSPESYIAVTTDTSYQDTSLVPLQHYYRLAAVDQNGNISPYSAAVTPSGVVAAHTGTGLPRIYALHANYPNPFNPVTYLPFDLPEVAQVRISIFDLNGKEVATLLDRTLPAGFHQARWDGRSASGRSLPTGVYIARMVAPGYARNHKMLLLK